MTLEQVFYLTQSIAGIAILASLVFVGFEVRHNSREARAQTEQHIASSWFVMAALISQHPAAFYAGLKSKDGLFSDMRENDRLTFISIIFALFKHYENIFRQFESGHIDEDTWTTWSTNVRIYFHQPGVQSWWKIRGAAFTASFRQFLESSARPELPSPVVLMDAGQPAHTIANQDRNV